MGWRPSPPAGVGAAGDPPTQYPLLKAILSWSDQKKTLPSRGLIIIIIDTWNQRSVGQECRILAIPRANRQAEPQ